MKYKLTNQTIIVNGRTLYRIKSLKKFSNVKKGDLGGYIEKVENLSQESNCWVYGNALVYGNCRVDGSALVHGNAHVYGNGRVYEGDITENINGENINSEIKSEIKVIKKQAKEVEIIRPNIINAIKWLDVCTE